MTQTTGKLDHQPTAKTTNPLAAQATGAAQEAIKRKRLRQRVGQTLRRDPAAMIGLMILSIILLMAILAPLLAPHDPGAVDPLKRLLPPFWIQPKGSPTYILGTDAVGRDILSRIIYGARVSLGVSLVSVILSSLVGVTLGLLAGYYGRWIDAVIMRVVDIQLAYPLILFAITIAAVFGASLKNLIIVLVIANWVTYTRIVRGEVLVRKRMQYVEAARVNGCRDGRIIRRHILPNVFSSILVIFTLQVAFVLILESGLSFLGLGVEPTIPTWGSMLNEGRTYIMTSWWVETFPGVAIMLAVLGINMLGDWIRDVLDPQLRVE
ncbi:MAG: ABC transporter permease [Caldilineaceae bacterium]